MKLVGVLNLC